MKTMPILLRVFAGLCLFLPVLAQATVGTNTDLAVGKTASTNAANVGGVLSFRLSVTNLGPATATSATIADVLPAGLAYLSATGSGTYNPVNGQWSLAPGAPGSVSILTITVQATNAGNWLNTASLTSSIPTDTNLVNNSASASVTVSSVTNYPPLVLNCPSNITVTATSSNGATVFFTATASGGCSPPPSVLATPPSGSTFPVGTTTVFTTASDTCGNSTNCSFTVTVVKPPISLTCSSNLTVTAPSSNGVVVFFNVSASGGCSPPPNVIATPPSGSTFPIGTTMVNVSAGDTCGTSTNCSFLVTVNPPVYPPIVLNCPSNLTATATSSNGATVFYTVTASGGCSLPAIVANPPSGSTFPIGTTTVFVTASDSCGGSTNCSFTVHVNPPAYPPILLNCSTNITVMASEAGGEYVFYDVSASGGCGPLTISSTPSSGDLFQIGTNTVSVVASDGCGNSTNCSFTVTVVEPPIVLNCSSNLMVTENAPGGAAVFFNVTASGGCDGTPTVESYPPSGSFFPFGTTIVSSTASDTCGNFTNCSFTVTVNPPGPIVLNCSSNLTVAAAGSGGTTVFYSVSASGGCSTPTVNAYPPSGSTFPVGPTTVFVTASDTCGNSTNCSFVVNVVATPIVLTCSSNITVSATSPGGATVFYGVTASGGCSLPSISAYPPSGSTFPVGGTTVFVTASDGCGNSTNCSFIVTVVRPSIVLNCSSNLTLTATSSNGASVFYSVTASGGCSLPSISAYPPSGSTFPAGPTTVFTTASDTCGNSTNCSFVVSVVRPPIVLNCSSNLTVTATSSNGATVFYNVTASGGCSPPIVNAYPPSGSRFPIGVTTVFTTASDGCDTYTNCSFTVTVTGTNPPTSGPGLSIRFTGTNHILLAWPTNATLSYSIAQILSLGGTNWVTLSNQPTVVGSSNQSVLILTNTQGFFRLISTATNTPPCLVSLTLTNCNQPESVTLTASTNSPTVSPGNPVNLSATLNLQPALVAVVSYYTNSTGYSANCPDTFVTSVVSPSIISSSWSVQGPGSFAASGSGLNAVFTPTGCGSGTVHFTVTWQHVCDPGQSTAYVSGAFAVNCATNCLIAGVSTNCAVSGSMALTNTTAGTNVCLGTAVTASVANLVTTNALIIITTSYTNSAGAVTTNCPPTFVTNTVAPMVISNWWTVSGPGSYTNRGAGLTATFTPTNGGSGVVIFNLTYANKTPCATNVLTAPPISVPFNVVQITNLAVSAIPTNRTRLTVGVGERVNLNLAGNPAGNYTWSTSAGGVQPTNGTATTFTAPSNAANATVRVNYDGGSCTMQFTAIEPSGILGTNARAQTGYTTNRAGAGMIIDNYLLPLTVSFYRVQAQEVPATSNLNVTGYFANTNFFPTGPPIHNAAAGAGPWIGTGWDNKNGVDTAASGTTLVSRQPWAAGSFTWPVPVVWRIGSGPTNNLTRTDQTFSITTNGTVSVQKFGHSVTRGTNGVVIVN